MKVVCELCKKVFKVNDGKLSSRGSTIHCPRCKHPHLVKRVVDPYPIEQEFKKPGTKESPRKTISTQGIQDPSITLEMEASGNLHLRKSETPPPTDERKDKPQYRWKEFLKSKKNRSRGNIALGRGVGIAWDRTFFYLAVLALLMGYIYHQSLPVPEQKARVEYLRGKVEELFRLVEKGK